MRKPILIVLLTLSVVLVIVLLIHFLPEPEKATDEPKLELPASFFEDGSGDGLNDWFKENIAGLDPNVANHRYIIFYTRHLDQPSFIRSAVEFAGFFAETGVPPENIITLTGEEANYVNLEQAVNEVAAKSTVNDLVLLRISTHGNPTGLEGGVKYAELDEWLDRIEAKVLILEITACHSTGAVPMLEAGAHPRIIFDFPAGDFAGGLGRRAESFITVDTEYGNNDGFVSLAELANWIDNRPRWGPERDKSSLEYWGHSKLTDIHNLAGQIYLTDYTPYDVPPAMEEYLESSSS